MANRVLTTVDDCPLVGGRLCVDFVNTTGARAGFSPRERLSSYSDLIVWSRRVEILKPKRASLLLGLTGRRPRLASRALADAIAFRESCYRIFLAITLHRKPAVKDLKLLNNTLVFWSSRRQLVCTATGARWSWLERPIVLDCVLGPIADSAAHLLTSTELSRLKKCGECDWLFVDTSKNSSRRWCKDTCANRVKSRTYYRRHRRRTSALRK